MGQALYRRYRPRSFAETVGQDAIIKTLAEAIKTGRISHAYLFTGPRGVGKTSIARILAHEVNQLPYESDELHLDIIEIDAASNRRIDEIRDLREKVHISPVSAKYKVYIIDEVHMLTKEAFNALLKTLEEPPGHCIFILATTEAHKLPDTIISRTQRFNFKPISRGETKKQLDKIVRGEKINIEKEALELLADFSEGSLRDNIGMLDQLSGSGKKISEADVRELLGIPRKDAIAKLTGYILESKADKALEVLESLQEQGTEPLATAKALGQSIREEVLHNGLAAGWVSALLKGLVSVSSSFQPQETLEITILESASRLPAAEKSLPRPSTTVAATHTAKPSAIDSPALNKQTFKNSSGTALDRKSWEEILARVKEEIPSLSNALSQTAINLSGDVLEITFSYKLHQKKVLESRNISTLSRVIKEVTGSEFKIKCVVDASPPKKEPAAHTRKPPRVASADSGENLDSISNIFGSAEVLES